MSCFTNNAWTVTRSLHYAWQGWKLAAECERDGAGTITAVRHFVWGPDIAGQQSASLESGAEGIGGLLLIREWKLGRGMKQYLPLTDGLGSVCGLIDATDGSLAAEYDYDPYGGPVIERGIAADACPFRHRTRYYDSESWLYYYGYRYYDPSTTKWISKDPLGEAGGWNLTCFCGNDPVNGYDPLGLEAYLVAADCSIGGRLRSWRNQVNADIFLSNYDLYEDEKNGELSRFGVSLARHIRRIPEGIKMSVVDTISSTYDRVTSDPIEAMTDPMGVKTGPKKAWNAISGVAGTLKSAYGNPSNQNIDDAIFIAEDLILLGYGAKQGYNSFNAPKPVALATQPIVNLKLSSAGAGGSAKNRVLFGQKRMDPTFSKKPEVPDYLRGRSVADVAADLRVGTLSADQLPVKAFWNETEELISVNTRTLGALSEAGMEPSIINIVTPTRNQLRRLTETPLINSPLPGPRIPVTPSQSDLTVLHIIETVQ